MINVVVSFHRPNTSMPTSARMSEMEDSLQQAFGNRFINLRKYMVVRWLKDAGVTANQEYIASIAHQQVPPPLQVADHVHLNADGYRLIAVLLKNKLKQLYNIQ